MLIRANYNVSRSFDVVRKRFYEVVMGQIRMIHDESWRAARLVVNHFETRLDDEELVESLHVVREIIAEALRQCFESRDQELRRLWKKNVPES